MPKFRLEIVRKRTEYIYKEVEAADEYEAGQLGSLWEDELSAQAPPTTPDDWTTVEFRHVNEVKD
jgi:hypothetical protein